MKNKILLLFLLTSIISFSQKKYQKTFYKNGNLKAEGWVENTQKIKYWKFYYQNGNLKKEGHFKNDLATKYWYFYRENSIKEREGHYLKGYQNKWWLYYDENGNINHKCQLKNNQKMDIVYCTTIKN